MKIIRMIGVLIVLCSLACFWYWYQESSFADRTDARLRDAVQLKKEGRSNLSQESYDIMMKYDPQIAKEARARAQAWMIGGGIGLVLGVGLLIAATKIRKSA